MSAGQPPQEVIDQLVGSSHGDLAKVKEILTQHPQLINASARWKETPIQAAAHVGARHVAEFLLSKGAPLEIYTAAMLGMKDKVEAFLQSDPAQARAKGAHGISALYHAAITGHIEIAQLLIAGGADVNEGEGGNTALHGAARFGQAAMAKWLLDHGARVNALDHEKKTPLKLAVEGGHTEAAELLRRHGGSE